MPFTYRQRTVFALLCALDLRNAVCTDSFVLEVNKIFGIAAEDTVSLVLFEYDLVILGVYLDRILYSKIKSSSEFDREHDPSQVIDLSDYSYGFH